MPAYYNEIDPHAAQWLRKLIAMADARYQSAYWEQVAVSEWWLSVVDQIIKR